MRITNNLRESVTRSETDKKFKSLIDDVKKNILAECERLVKSHIAEYPCKITDDLINNDFIQITNGVRLNDINGKREYFDLYNYYPIQVHKSKFELVASPLLISLIETRNKLGAEEKKFRHNLNRVLYAFNTSKQLIAAIPELAHYFKDEQKAQGLSLIPIEDINKLRSQLK
jgi:hypothetical protein